MKRLVALFMICIAVMLTGCNSKDSNREKMRKTQDEVYRRATSEVPNVEVSNFVIRKNVAKYMSRSDQVGKLYYIYLLGREGNIIGYYVGQSKPIPSCIAMTSPDQITKDYTDQTGDYGGRVVRAPTLDGVYSGGPCNSYFFFDGASDALVEFSNMSFYVSDAPVNVKADAITIQHK